MDGVGVGPAGEESTGSAQLPGDQRSGGRAGESGAPTVTSTSAPLETADPAMSDQPAEGGREEAEDGSGSSGAPDG